MIDRDEQSQYRTWGSAFTGTEYYHPPVVNVPQRLRRKFWSAIGLIAVYALWGGVIFEVGFYVGRWYEGRP